MDVGNLPDLASSLGKFCHPLLPAQTLVILFMHVVSFPRSTGSPEAGMDRPTSGAQKSRPAVEKCGANLGACWSHQHVLILGKPRRSPKAGILRSSPSVTPGKPSTVVDSVGQQGGSCLGFAQTAMTKCWVA